MQSVISACQRPPQGERAIRRCGADPQRGSDSLRRADQGDLFTSFLRQRAGLPPVSSQLVVSLRANPGPQSGRTSRMAVPLYSDQMVRGHRGSESERRRRPGPADPVHLHRVAPGRRPRLQPRTAGQWAAHREHPRRPGRCARRRPAVTATRLLAPASSALAARVAACNPADHLLQALDRIRRRSGAH